MSFRDWFSIATGIAFLLMGALTLYLGRRGPGRSWTGLDLRLGALGWALLGVSYFAGSLIWVRAALLLATFLTLAVAIARRERKA